MDTEHPRHAPRRKKFPGKTERDLLWYARVANVFFKIVTEEIKIIHEMNK